jgi:signal transduction histidine kinase
VRLVGEILDVAQTEAGLMTLDIERCDVSSLASQAVELARPAGRRGRIDLRLHVGSVAPVAGDPSRLSQTLDNLVSNAIKFTTAP